MQKKQSEQARIFIKKDPSIHHLFTLHGPSTSKFGCKCGTLLPQQCRSKSFHRLSAHIELHSVVLTLVGMAPAQESFHKLHLALCSLALRSYGRLLLMLAQHCLFPMPCWEAQTDLHSGGLCTSSVRLQGPPSWTHKWPSEPTQRPRTLWWQPQFAHVRALYVILGGNVLILQSSGKRKPAKVPRKRWGNPNASLQ